MRSPRHYYSVPNSDPRASPPEKDFLSGDVSNPGSQVGEKTQGTEIKSLQMVPHFNGRNLGSV